MATWQRMVSTPPVGKHGAADQASTVPKPTLLLDRFLDLHWIVCRGCFLVPGWMLLPWLCWTCRVTELCLPLHPPVHRPRSDLQSRSCCLSDKPC
jgi:hypothetical protein